MSLPLLNCVLSLSSSIQNFQRGQTHKSLPLTSFFCAVTTCGVNPHENLLMWVFSHSSYKSLSLTVPYKICWWKVKCALFACWLTITGISNCNYSLSCQKTYYTCSTEEIIWIVLPNVRYLFRAISLIWQFVIKWQRIYLYQGSIYKHSFYNNSYGQFPSGYWTFPYENIFLPQ